MTNLLFEDSPSLLRDGNLASKEVRNLLAPVGLKNWENAYRSLQRIAEHSPQASKVLADCLPTLLQTLANTVEPDRVLVSFERFVHSAPDPTELLSDLSDNLRAFEILFTLFTGSQFLTEILLRHPEYFEQLTDHKQLSQTKTAEELHHEARAVVTGIEAQAGQLMPDDTEVLDALRQFQRRELLRIGTCDLLGLLDLPTITAQLSYLADGIVDACAQLAAHQTHTDPQGFVVLAMGKLGGGEINYSSDIDLIFLTDTEANGYIRLGQKLIDALDRTTGEGFLYRVDMRLRPWGRSGALVYTIDAHVAYLQKHAGLWERQALLKARPIAGNLSLGQQFLQRIRPLIFNTDGEIARVEIHKLKQRIEGQLQQRGRGWGEVKLGQGSIRDIEFVTQYLQLAHGQNKALDRSDTANTLDALANLSTAGILPGEEYRGLADGYIFLRTVEHHLQLMHYRQTHTLPNDEQALAHLAHRLAFEGPEAGAHFTAQYQKHSAVIRAIYQRHLANSNAPPEESSSKVFSLLSRMPAAYAKTFSEADIQHHADLILKLERENKPVEVEAVPLEDDIWQVTIVGYDYLGELSLMCGLFAVYGFNIVKGNVFTYGPSLNGAAQADQSSRSKRSSTQSKQNKSQRNIVDVFILHRVETKSTLPVEEVWANYTGDLTRFLKRLQRGEQREVQGELARRFAEILPQLPNITGQLLPVEINIDNDSHKRHTILHIDAVDTVGFLYEFTNALALTGINVRSVTVNSEGNRVRDILNVTDSHGNKITAPEKQQELRVATVLIKYFTHLLPNSPDPQSALLQFREFIGQLFMRPNWSTEIGSLEQPDVLRRMARLLGVSQFLWQDFLRMQHANLFQVVKDNEALQTRKSKTELREELAVTLYQADKGSAQVEALNAFKDREMFRIDMRQIQRYITEFGQFSAELTDLAEVVVEAAQRIAAQELRGYFGLPQLQNRREAPLTVVALGKCGGRELGFASDIELMFIFAGDGKTTGPRVISTGEYYSKLVQNVTQIIQTKQKGVFEIDLRLRPYGQAGSMAVSLESFQRYFGPDGDAWPYERQALVKLRPIAGDLKLGMQVVKLRDELIYTGQPFDVAAMRAMRERQLRHLVTAGTINAKFSPGGLVDVEYLVQGLQITHGHRDPSLRQTNTGDTMSALAAANIIPAADYPRLRQAHIFLRRLINALRMVRGNAEDLTVPNPSDDEFAFLARRLDYGDDLARLQDDLHRFTSYVYELNQVLLET